MPDEEDPFDMINGRPMYWNRQGEPMTRDQWLASYEDREQQLRDKRVAEDTIGPYWISTVWLGIDHALWMVGPPVIFETMVFVKHDEDGAPLGPEVDYQLRYSTEAEALAGHAETVLMVRATYTPVETQIEEEQE